MISKHVLYFSLATAATVVFALTSIKYGTKTDEEMVRDLEALNSSTRAERAANKAQMQGFFNRMKNGDQEQQQRMDNVIRGGRDGGQRRQTDGKGRPEA